MTGLPTGGKYINVSQLQGEIQTAGASISGGLGLFDQSVCTFSSGQPADFAPADVPKVQQCITNHVALRSKSDAEYATEFQDSATSAARKQEIRDIMNGLLPREQVPMP